MLKGFDTMILSIIKFPMMMNTNSWLNSHVTTTIIPLLTIIVNNLFIKILSPFHSLTYIIINNCQLSFYISSLTESNRKFNKQLIDMRKSEKTLNLKNNIKDTSGKITINAISLSHHYGRHHLQYYDHKYHHDPTSAPLLSH